MVNVRPDRAGRGTLGCITSIVVLILVVFLVLKFLPPWMHYEQFVDAMRDDARYGVTLPDSAIRASLMAQADTLGLPPAARRIIIRRGGIPPTIRISTEYSDTVWLPLLGPKVLHFKPAAEDGI